MAAKKKYSERRGDDHKEHTGLNDEPNSGK